MVQVLEKPQELILIEVPKVKKEVKPNKIQEIKAKLSQVKNYAKKHEYYLNIKDVKTKMATNSYGMRLFRNY
ncbi:MAG: hypothetical protein ACFFEO_12185 [Candidatus Thorarchaeota archaeon]